LTKFLKTKIWRIPLIALVALSLILVGGGAALAAATANYSSDIPVTANTIEYWSLSVTTDGSAGCAATDTTAGSPYVSGTAVSITATTGAGYVFAGWTLTSGAGSFGDASNPSTTFTTGSAATVVQANFTLIPVFSFPLYTDMGCTIPFTGSIDFGTINIVDGQPVTKILTLYFKANKSRLVPGGYGSGDVNPYTVVMTDDCTDSNIDQTYAVGEPMGALAHHPCYLIISITVHPGATSPVSFTVHVTGSNDLSIN
jgi:uncharacterized repeat protein (TIGR02543 family)